MKKILTTIFLLIALCVSAVGQTITLNQSQTYQTWRGFEATMQVGEEYLFPGSSLQYPSTSYAQYKTAVLNATLDLPITRLRVEIAMNDENATGYDTNLSTYAAVNDNADPNVLNPAGFHYDRLTRQMDSFVTEHRQSLINQGKSLYIVLCVVDFRHAGFKAQDTPAEYAEFVYAFVKKFNDTYGYLPNAIEPILEADNQADEWTPAELANNIVAAKARLDAAGYTGFDWVTPSVTNANNLDSWWANMKTANPSVTAIVTDLSYHRYLAHINLAPTANGIVAEGKRLSMNEWIGADQDTLHEDLTVGQVSSWQQFVIAGPDEWLPGGSTDDGSQYFRIDTSTWAITSRSRTRYLKQYFRYILPESVRKGASTNNSNFQPVAFVKNNKYVVVIKCAAGGTINVAGLDAGEYGITYTTASATHQSLSNQTITTGQNVSFTMPASGAASVYRIGFDAPSLVVNYYGATPPPTN